MEIFIKNQIKHRFKVDKLIRDLAYQHISPQSGVEICERTMEDEEYDQRLKDKLLEEAQEVLEARDTQELEEELADVLEVLMAIARFKGIEFSDVVKCADQKRSKKGGFEARKYAEFVDILDSDPRLPYYLAKPNKYPEIKTEEFRPEHSSVENRYRY